MRLALAALLAAGAIAASLLALDAHRVASAIAVDDTTYRLAPERPHWDTGALLPFDLAPRLLGVAEELAYRRALQRLAALHARELQSNGRDFSVLIARAQQGLVDVSQTDRDPHRRSEATNVLGVFAVANPGAYSGSDPTFAAGVRSFRAAVLLDPTNEQAKRNLEIVLRGLRRQLLPLERSGSGGKRLGGGAAGIGRSGGGY